MRVAVFHNSPAPGEGLDAQDVFEQVELVREGLSAAGHEAITVPLHDLAEAATALSRARPDAVFNLVEAVGGIARRHPSAAALLEDLRLPYTGSSASALELTLDKPRTKEVLERDGLPAPAGHRYRGALDAARIPPPPGPWIVKPAAEDASIGIDDDSVFLERTALAASLPDLFARHGDLLVENFVDGREFNASVIAGEAGPEVLPLAEIRFVGYPDGKPRLLGYRAKWDTDSFEYRSTERTFARGPDDGDLIPEIRRIALRCWTLFGLRGYARVDFRVDPEGRPWCLEVNANPCLTADAGFVAAARQAGLSVAETIARILADRNLPCS